jgi:hypothetical protein
MKSTTKMTADQMRSGIDGMSGFSVAVAAAARTEGNIIS